VTWHGGVAVSVGGEVTLGWERDETMPVGLT
jgi:hypothetical protein